MAKMVKLMFKKKIYQSSFINYFSNSTLQEPPKDLDPWLDSFSSWSHAQRLCAIDLLIGRCHPTQVRHMMAVIEPQFQRDFISLLPKGKTKCLFTLCCPHNCPGIVPEIAYVALKLPEIVPGIKVQLF